MKGGTPYSSASSYGSYVNGSGNAQFNRVFDQTGQYAKFPGNAMIGAQGQKAGKRRKRSKSRRTKSRRTRRKRGGDFVSSAAVPLSLLAMQQSYQPGTISNMTNKSLNFVNNNRPRFSKRRSFRSNRS
jgi:hypothetical protein